MITSSAKLFPEDEDRSGMQVNAKGNRFKLSRDHAGLGHFASFESLHAETVQDSIIRNEPRLKFPSRSSP